MSLAEPGRGCTRCLVEKKSSIFLLAYGSAFCNITLISSFRLFGLYYPLFSLYLRGNLQSLLTADRRGLFSLVDLQLRVI